MDILIEFEKRPLLFTGPDAVVTCYDGRDLPRAFASLEDYRARGYYLAGFLSYEAGYAFEACLKDVSQSTFPLLMFGCFRGCEEKRLPSSVAAFQVGTLRSNVDKRGYDVSIETIREHIRRGDVYQITYCIKNHCACRGDLYSLYRALLSDQPVPYPAYIHTDDCDILSLSPELFFKKTGAYLVTKPMKGTWPRGRNILEDCAAGLRLKYDKKNRAENIMIADLLRNDLGRIGTCIRAPRLFDVARYATLYQMTSTVTARVDPDIRFERIVRALFPSGSVTGAPKIRAMQIIREVETEHRNIYTGAIGYCTPGNDFFFSIPIRTLLVRDGQGELGVGGGIVWDSTPDGEWAESRLKSAFLAGRA